MLDLPVKAMESDISYQAELLFSIQSEANLTWALDSGISLQRHFKPGDYVTYI